MNVTVTTPGGTSATSSADQFTYAVAAAPAVTALSPNNGPPAGGTLVTITGTGFTGAIGGRFRNHGRRRTSPSSATLRSRPTVPRARASVNVTVTAPTGTSAVSPADEFTYTAAAVPVVTRLSPTTGLPVGGTLVTITGTSFTGATAVDFGTTPATNLTVVNDTTITADSPAGTGTVDVTVTTPVGTSATSSADLFTYTARAGGHGPEPDQLGRRSVARW